MLGDLLSISRSVEVILYVLCRFILGFVCTLVVPSFICVLVVFGLVDSNCQVIG